MVRKREAVGLAMVTFGLGVLFSVICGNAACLIILAILSIFVGCCLVCR